MSRLNLGCGSIQRDGWVGVDRDDYGHNMVADATDGMGLLGYQCYDGIVANHFLCQLDYHQIPGVLAECRDLLKPGGVLRVLVPNLLGAVNAWERSERAWFPQNNDVASIDQALCSYITWFGTNRSVFTPGYLHELLAGFDTVVETRAHRTVLGPDWITELDDREHESLVFEARK